MKKLLIAAAVAAIAGVPAVTGLVGNASFAQSVPVQVPASAKTFGDHGRHAEPGDDRGQRARAACSAAVIPRLGVAAVVIPRFGALAAVIAGLGVVAAVIPGLDVMAAVVNGASARRDVDGDALCERRIARQADDAGHGCDCRHRGGDQQFLHGFFLPWVGLQVVKPEPRLGPPLVSRPSTWWAMALSTPTATRPGGSRFRPRLPECQAGD